ncbi:MarR family winged helix-turn-helix transcriptional regulator [Streptomyces sp. NBC_01244]|uniref:MarR family winged helix-turn-helix transcriptional regulator n=1 Tax=Streptomyces sp. NBC_01244 TaxID=2903797 RepID=UPI002E109D4B|nr:MarR family transcriptional regulator [Streptomyces sp. NBC_01244]
MRLPIDQRLGHHLKRVEQELIAAKHTSLRPFKLNVPQYSVLLALSQEPGLSGAVLARRCMVTPQTMSSVLATLEGRSLVERKPHPVHSHILEARLTRTGQTLLSKADESVVEVELLLTEEFSTEEAEELIGRLQRCSAALAKASDKGPRKTPTR